jgi:hypothetical protein
MHDMILQIGKFQPKDISGTCRVHHPWCVGHDKPLC